jgi:hypothetical protein
LKNPPLFYYVPNNMRTSALDQLAEKGTVFIQIKGSEWLVECVCKDEYGFLAGRVCVWGKNLI